jgi:peptidoglycan/xylan/chitin deacetylase (PgdA/CDA1 family)
MSTFAWPGGQTAAVTLRFDDGFESHRTESAPLLESFGLRGTFYVCPTGTESDWLARAHPWRAVLDAGHEIGNHTMSHPAPVALFGEPGPRCYEQLTLDAYQADVLEAHRRLELAFGPREWSFCYPCYQTWVGVGPHRRSVVPFIAEHFAAACVGGEISKPFNVPEHCDLHALMSVHTEGLRGDELIARVELARKLGRWAILTFHAIDKGHLPVARRDFEQLIGHLRDNADSIWTAPLIDVALHVRSARGVR